MRDPSHDAKADSTGRDYESLGADIVVSHVRDVMRTRISALRSRLRSAFSTVPEKPRADESTETDS